MREEAKQHDTLLRRLLLCTSRSNAACHSSGLFSSHAGCTGKEDTMHQSVKEKKAWGVIRSGLSHLLLHKDPDSPYGELTPLNFQIVSSGPRKPEPVCCESTTAFCSSPKVMWHGQDAIKRMQGSKVNSVQLNILSTGLKTNQNYLFKLLSCISPITKNSIR